MQTVSTAENSKLSRTEFAQEYAEFSSSRTLANLPREAITAAQTNLFDTMACAIAGSSALGVSEARSLVESWGGSAQATVFCSGLKVPAHHAAFVNGMMSHARDFDDTHDAAVLHAGVSVVPAALAAAQLNPEATGADLLAGVVIGLELVCRLGVATKVGIIESGFMYTSLFGHFGATAAAARVLGMDAAQTANALGIVYSRAAGTHQVTRDGASTKRMQPGFAAEAALVAVQLSRLGIRGCGNTFEGEDGLFRSYLRDKYDPDTLRSGLGERFEMTNLSYKPYPCCRYNHTAIDAALALRKKHKIVPDRIRRITVNVNRGAYEAVCTPEDVRRAPKTIVQAQFSIPYAVSCALVDGEVGLAHFTDEGIANPTVLALTAQVTAQVDEVIERDWSRSISPSHIIIETDDGVFEERVDCPKGGPDAPMNESDFAAKLKTCVAISGLDWPDDLGARLRTGINGLETASRAGALVDVMTPLA